MKLIRLTGALAAVAMLAACSDDNDSDRSSQTPTQASFQVRVVNLTAAQPLSPVAVIAHGNGYRAFVDGTVATEGLEMLAEAGDNADLLAEANDDDAVFATASSSGPVPPASTQTDSVSVSFSMSDADDARLTVVTMLVNTNDAFTGINAVNVGGMAVGQSRTFSAPAWDSGTEANSETAATIPGPIAGGDGTGYGAEKELRADNSRVPVRFHPGVVGNTGTEDGLPTSVLTELHRFDNPVSRIIVTRVQ